jgi:hypothetical protein
VTARFAAWARFLALGALSCGASVAHAHAPQARSVALTPDGAAVAIAMPGFGILLRSRASQPFAYLCDAALEQQPTDAVPSLVFLSDGSLLIGSADGARILGPNGCPGEPITSNLASAVIVAVAAQPRTDIVYAVTAGDLPGLWRSTDAGRSWQLQSSLSHAELVSALRVSPDDSDTLYLSRGGSPGKSALLVSTDAGASFSAFEQDRELTLLQVQADNPKRLWALARSADNTSNRGFDLLQAQRPQGPWLSILRVNYFGGFSIDAHGVVWVGDESGGVYRSSDGGDTFSNVAPKQAVACLAAAGDALWACTPGTNLQPALITRGTANTSFTQVVAFADVNHLLECATKVDAPARCAAAWLEWRRDVRMEDQTAPAAAGPQPDVDAGTDASAAPKAMPDAAHGACSIHGMRGGSGRAADAPVAGLGLLMVLIAARARKRRQIG